ncbi:MAG: hypothetical protein IPH65_17605, partial [Dehalococcoidia bacterium]|uniref:hypothetical protein n=1 Tax=Candidatus Amarobacter glycogenicus TaxID=3140699 RepID=UPI0031358F18|nr:hypothetical protein [Dehalococcoidia bacterium]
MSSAPNAMNRGASMTSRVDAPAAVVTLAHRVFFVSFGDDIVKRFSPEQGARDDAEARHDGGDARSSLAWS